MLKNLGSSSACVALFICALVTALPACGPVETRPDPNAAGNRTSGQGPRIGYKPNSTECSDELKSDYAHDFGLIVSDSSSGAELDAAKLAISTFGARYEGVVCQWKDEQNGDEFDLDASNFSQARLSTIEQIIARRQPVPVEPAPPVPAPVIPAPMIPAPVTPGVLPDGDISFVILDAAKVALATQGSLQLIQGGVVRPSRELLAREDYCFMIKYVDSAFVRGQRIEMTIKKAAKAIVLTEARNQEFTLTCTRIGSGNRPWTITDLNRVIAGIARVETR